MKRCILTGLGGRGLHWLSAVNKRDDVDVVAGVEPSEANRVRAEERGMPLDKMFVSLDRYCPINLQENLLNGILRSWRAMKKWCWLPRVR